MQRRKGDGCPVSGALQVVGDKWTLLVVRDLVGGARRTTELLASLHPISSRTLLERLRNLERDELIERHSFSTIPPHVEYALTDRGRLLLPLLDLLHRLGEQLGCNECTDRQEHLGDYCDACPHHNGEEHRTPVSTPPPRREPRRERERDDSIILL